MTSSRQKLLIILTPGFPADEQDTTCLPMQQELILAINRRYPGWTVKILSFQYPFVAKTYQWFGNEVISFGGRNKGTWRRLLLRQKVRAKLKQVLHGQSIDGLFSFWFGECAVVGKKIAEANKLKHYCWLLGQDARETNPYPRRMPMQASELVALSDFLQEEYERNHGVRPLRVIPPGVSEHLLIPSPGHRDIDILGAGSLIQLKNFDLFIELVGEVKATCPGIRAVVVGDGPERFKLRQKIVQLGLEPNITLTGKLAYPQVLEFMKRTKVFLHPSSYEGFSGVCMEAVSSGAQVISFCRPMKEPIDNWTSVESRKHMLDLTLRSLERTYPATSQQRFRIDETARKIIGLFE